MPSAALRPFLADEIGRAYGEALLIILLIVLVAGFVVFSILGFAIRR